MQPTFWIVFDWALYLSLPIAYVLLVVWSFNQGTTYFAGILLASLAALAYVLVRQAPYNPKKLEGLL